MAEWADIGIQIEHGRSRYAIPCPNCSRDRKPEHQKLPCLTINNVPGDRWWNCWNCQWKGSLEVMDRYDKVKEQSRMPEQTAEIKTYSIEFRKYLKPRGLTVRTLLDRKIYELKGRSRHNVGFPFFVHNSLVNVKFFNMKHEEDPKGGPRWFQLPKKLGTKVCFWGLDELVINTDPRRSVKNEVIITEGEWDRLTWIECGYGNVLSVPMGAPNAGSKNLKNELVYLYEPFFKSIASYVDVWYLSVDDDENGHFLKELLARELGKVRCRIVQYPVGYKDINEVLGGNKKKKLAALGPDEVKKCRDNTHAYPIRGIIRPSMIRERIAMLRTKGFTPGLGTGVPELDYFVTFKRNQITLITGIPNMGKTTFIRWILIRLVQNNPELNLKFGMFTPENRPVEREIAKIAEALTGRSIYTDAWNAMSDEQYRSTMNFIEKHFHIVAPDRDNFEDFDGKVQRGKHNTLDSIFKYVGYLARTENIFGYVIDAWNKVDHQMPRGVSETTFIQNQLQRVLDFNEYYNVHAFIVVHPTKMESDRRNANFFIPSLYDVKGSSAWNEMIDIGMIVHRNMYRYKTDEEKANTQGEGDMDVLDNNVVVRRGAPTILKIAKMRFEEIGNIGILRFAMMPDGGFEVNKYDKGKHLKETERKKKLEEEAKKEYALHLQPEIPDFIADDMPDDDSSLAEDLPF